MEEQLLKNAHLELCRSFPKTPAIAVVLGSGLGAWADTLEDAMEVPYSAITGLLPSTIEGHDGKFVMGMKNGVRVIACKGRVHCYEGHSSTEVVRLVRLCAMLGVSTLIVTNAAGGINVNYNVGDFMVLRDHICLVPSPLIGANIDALGTRFLDLGEVYDKTLLENLTRLSPRPLQVGVYVQVMGPQYETPSEASMYRNFGADAIGMSTAIEAIAARHAGLKVLGISCITATATSINDFELSHKDVQSIVAKKNTEFMALLDLAVTVVNNQK